MNILSFEPIDGITPPFFLGDTGTDAKQITGLRRIVGAHPFPRFQQAFEQLLSKRER